MWLMGYDEHKNPLTPTQTFSDISSDYAQKTVTIEPFPHLNGLNLASVHPCKHSSVMKKVIERMDGSFKQAQQKQASAGGSVSKKKGWIGGVVKKAAGAVKDKDKKSGVSPPGALTGTPQGDGSETEVEGLRVDQCVKSNYFLSRIVSTDLLTLGCFVAHSIMVNDPYRYLLVFLKFISSVVPTIEIDSTTSV